jgi:predicted alpha/beta hydrolase family esterase
MMGMKLRALYLLRTHLKEAYSLADWSLVLDREYTQMDGVKIAHCKARPVAFTLNSYCSAPIYGLAAVADPHLQPPEFKLHFSLNPPAQSIPR